MPLSTVRLNPPCEFCVCINYIVVDEFTSVSCDFCVQATEDLIQDSFKNKKKNEVSKSTYDSGTSGH